MAKSVLCVGDILDAVRLLYKRKDAEYGNAYVRAGHILAVLFPDGIELKTVQDHNRYTLVAHIVGDLCRYTGQFECGGHKDSLDDLIAYGAMLGLIDRTKESR